MDTESSQQMIINPAQQVHGREEIQSAYEVLLSGMWAEGPKTEEFKKEFSKYVGMRYVTLVNSGSSANLAAIMALTTDWIPANRRLGPWAEVITPALCFPTTVSPIKYSRATPVFVDVDDTWNIDINQVIDSITNKTRVIIAAHNLGNPINMQALREICDKKGIYLITDSCDALGAEYNGSRRGALGDIATSSFYPAHHMSAGEAGAVYTDDPRIYRAITTMVNWGRSCFIKDSIVKTQVGYRFIQDVQVGDIVLTHRGTLKKVYDTLIKEYKGKLYKIKVPYKPVITCTTEHSFYVKRGDSYVWVKAEDLKVNDLLVENVQGFGLSLDKEVDLGRLCGYYLCEGSLARNLKGKSGYKENKYFSHKVEFTVNKHKKEYQDDLIKLMNKYFGVKGNIRKAHNSDKALKITFKSRKAYEFFLDNFGRGAKNKKIGELMQTKSIVFLNQVVKGFFAGDGSTSKTHFNMGSSSLNLIEEIRSILQYQGIYCSKFYREIDKHKNSYINGKLVKPTVRFNSLNIYGKNAARFAEIILNRPFELRSNRAKSDKILTDYEFYYFPIENIEVLDDQNVKVYNLEIEDDHSYTVENIVVHNCYCPPGHDNTCGRRYSQQSGGLPQGYDHKNTYSELGFNLKSTDIQAALLVEQMKRLPGFIKLRNYNHAFLFNYFSKFSEWFDLPKVYDNATPSWFGYVIKLSDKAPFTRDEMVIALDNMGIRSRAFFCGNITRQPALWKKGGYRTSRDLSKSDEIMNTAFWIGVHPAIGDEQRSYMTNILDNFLNKYL